MKGGPGAVVEPTVCNRKVPGSSPSLCILCGQGLALKDTLPQIRTVRKAYTTRYARHTTIYIGSNKNPEGIPSPILTDRRKKVTSSSPFFSRKIVTHSYQLTGS
jgi:hypothetical protein